MNLQRFYLVVIVLLSLCRCKLSSPIVTIISVGYREVISSSPYVIKAAGCITLVQSKGKNILVDTGTTNMATSVRNILRHRKQLALHDIDFTFITHTHPGHYSNVLMFSKEQSVGAYNVTGDIFTGTNHFLEKFA